MKNNKNYIALRKPGFGRKRFKISIKEEGQWRTLDIAELDDLNDRFTSGNLSFVESEEKAKKIVRRLYKARDSNKQSALESNTQLMYEYYAYKYEKDSRKRRLAASTAESALNDLKRAMLAVGNLDIKYCSVDKLQEAVDKYYEGYDSVEPHKKTVMRLNSLMRFIGRSSVERLEVLPENHTEVKNLSHEEFLKVTGHLDQETYDLSNIAYYSGLRLGEIFALEKKKVRKIPNGFIFYVDRQMYRARDYSLPKRRKVRRTFAFSKCSESLQRWLDTPESKRVELRNRRYSKLVADACTNENVGNILSFKDWRHCYAISLLNMGATISQVAQNLGNSEQVCRKYYLGYVMTNDGIEMMANVVSGNEEFFF